MAFDAGTGFVDIVPAVNPLAFNAALTKQITPALNSASTKLRSATSQLGAALGTPLGATVGAGALVAIGKLTLGFESAFTRIAALSNASEADIGRWKDQVLTLSGETAQAPQELADALFFLSSAGLKANDIFPALEQSAQAAAVGLGTTADVANIVASALNAYAESGLKAADVTDTLVAAVREGRAEPDAFAEAMGRILPIASRAGVGFDEVAASLAGLSNIGLDVNEGVTAMRGLLASLVAPGTLAAKTLRELGISTDQMREALSEGGLLAALQLLEERTGGNIDILRKIIPNIRSLTGELGLTGENAEKVAAIFEAVTNSTGALAEAFRETQAGPAFKFQQALAEIQEAAIRLGQVVLPLGSDLAGAFITTIAPVTALLELLGKIPGAASAVLFAFLAFKALNIVPDVLFRIADGLHAVGASKVGTGIDRVGVGLASLASAANFVTAAIALTEIGFSDMRREAEANARSIEALADLFAAGAIDIEDLNEGFRSSEIPEWAKPQFEEHLQAVIVAARKLRQEEAELDAVVEANAENIERSVLPAFGKAADLFDAMGTNAKAFANEASTAMGDSDKAFKEFSQGAIEDAAKTIEDFRESATDNLNFTADALAELSGEATSAAEELASADLSVMEPADIRALREAADLTAGELLRSFRDARAETRAFGQDLLIISRTGGQAGEDAAEALLNMGSAGQAAADTIASAAPKMREKLVEAFSGGEGAAESLANRLTRRLIGTLESIKEILEAIASEWDIEIEANTSAANTQLDALVNRMNEIDGSTATTHVVTVFEREGSGFPPVEEARGAIIRAATGFITSGPTILAGESHAPTFAGRGAEGIIPFDDRGLGILAEALRRAGAGGGDVHVTVMTPDNEVLGRAVSKAQHRRRQLVGG